MGPDSPKSVWKCNGTHLKESVAVVDLAVFTAEEPDARRVMSVSIPYSRWSSFKMGETIFLPQLRIVAPLGRPLNPPLTRY